MSTATNNSQTRSLDSICEDYPEVRVHLAHLRAMHLQRMRGVNDPVLPKLKVRPAPPKDDMVNIKVKLDPEVLDVFRASGTGWKERINDVLFALVGGGEGVMGTRHLWHKRGSGPQADAGLRNRNSAQ